MMDAQKGFNSMQRRAAILLSALWFAAPTIFAQGTGTIHGSVTDPAKAAVADAKVTAVLDERGTTRSVTTDAQGSFVFPLLPTGRYTVKVEVSGFKSFAQTGIELSAN